MDWKRHAIYWLPDGALGRAGAAWLGWDARSGQMTAEREASSVEAPARYGFHATLMPPFRLVGPEAALLDAAAGLAATMPALAPQAFHVADLGGFLALRPGDDGPARTLAAEVVAGLDRFRAPPAPEDLTRRRAAGLTPAQDALLVRWGYPYVMAEHRLHLTLTGPRPPAPVAAAARAHLADVLLEPHAIAAISAVGEDADGRFHLIADLPLGSAHAAAPA